MRNKGGAGGGEALGRGGGGGVGVWEARSHTCSFRPPRVEGGAAPSSGLLFGGAWVSDESL